MEAYLFYEKPILCYNTKCMASGSRYLKKVWIEKKGKKIGGFFECQVCGAMHIHLKTYQSKTMNPEVTLLNPNDEKTIIREYTLKRYKIKENKELEKRNRREIELDRLYRETNY